MNDLIRIANEVAQLERLAAEPSYKDYVKKKKRKGEKPLDKDAWEARVKGKGEKKPSGRERRKQEDWHGYVEDRSGMGKKAPKAKPPAKIKKLLNLDKDTIESLEEDFNQGLEEPLTFEEHIYPEVTQHDDGGDQWATWDGDTWGYYQGDSPKEVLKDYYKNFEHVLELNGWDLKKLLKEAKGK